MPPRLQKVWWNNLQKQCVCFSLWNTEHRTHIEAFWNFFQKKFHSNLVSAIMTQMIGCRARQSGPDSSSSVRMLLPCTRLLPDRITKHPVLETPEAASLILRLPRISEHSHAYLHSTLSHLRCVFPARCKGGNGY